MRILPSAHHLRDPFVACALTIAAFEIALQAFRIRSWEDAGLRGLFLLVMVIAFILLRRVPPSMARLTADRPRLRHLARWFIVVALLWNGVLSVIAIHHTIQTGEIRMDQGQATYRAALGLWRGENPYGPDALLDYYSYFSRMPLRLKAGVGPTIPPAVIASTFGRYWETLDPTLREQLLPKAPPNASPLAKRETDILGYKYGPVPVVATALLAPLLGRSAVPALNIAGTFGLFVLLALILRRANLRSGLAAQVFLGCLVDHFPTWYYVHFSDSDIWPLFFCTLAVLAFARRWDTVLGLALALAVASKTFPSALYLPLILAARSWRAAAIFVLSSAALFLPWLIWDAGGFIRNVMLWPAIMQPDTTSWIRYVPDDLVLAIRVAVLLFVATLLLRLAVHRESRLFWTLATSNMAIVAIGTVIHNNYVPWFSLWGVFAIAEIFSGGTAVMASYVLPESETAEFAAAARS